MRALQIILILIPFLGQAEIKSVQLTWNSTICQKDCAEQIQRQLEKVPQLTQVSVSQSNGMATLQWKEGETFSFIPIRNAVKRVGVTVETVRVSVQGRIEKRGKDFMIHSEGDQSRFRLLGIPKVEAGTNRFAIQSSPYNRPLSKQQEALLEASMKEGKIVTINGAILKLDQFPPLDLIIESIK